MTAKNIKEEARKKLALNIHQAIIVYTIEYTIFATLIALIVMACVALSSINIIAAIVMICYGLVLLFIAVVGSAMINFAMSDFYLVSYRCKPYNIRRLGETVAHSNITKVLLVSVKRIVLGFLLLLCLIVPGVIYLIRTSMANYLLIANPKMKVSTALTASNKIMSGKTGTYFSLCVSVLGWYLLGVLTLGLGFIFINPYLNQIKTVFYKRNLQGDKAVYTVSPQALSASGNVQTVSTPQQVMSTPSQPQPVEQANQAYVPKQPPVQGHSTPIDTLDEEDVMDMNAAMQDFDEQNAFVDVPEVPITPPQKKKKTKIKMTREEKRQAKAAAASAETAQSHRIDGTGLVETERVLTTKEITDSDIYQRSAIEHIYSNSERQAPKIDYFSSGSGLETNGFVDDFGVEPDGPAAAPVVEPVVEPVAVPVVEPAVEPVAAPTAQAEAPTAEPVMSDLEFDEFLRNFDREDVNNSQNGEAAQAQPSSEATAPTPTAPRSAADRRREAEERIERDRRAAAERLSQSRQQQTDRNSDIAERSERLRRERDRRLHENGPLKNHNNNPKGTSD